MPRGKFITFEGLDGCGKSTQMRRLAERLRAQMEAHAYHAEAGAVIKITGSVGVASFPDQAQTKEDLVRLADQAMYRAKGAQRNFVYSALQDQLGRLVLP